MCLDEEYHTKLVEGRVIVLYRSKRLTVTVLWIRIQYAKSALLYFMLRMEKVFEAVFSPTNTVEM